MYKCLIKNKFITTIIGTIGLHLAIAFLLPMNSFSVYITSYIHFAPSQSFVTLHYGMFINLFFSFANNFSKPLGGYIENLVGFDKTMIIGLAITFAFNIGFFLQRNIFICYAIAICMGIGAGIGTSLVGKNLVLYYPKKKGIITGLLTLGVIILTSMFVMIGEKFISLTGYTLKKGEEYYPEDIAKRIMTFFMIGEGFIPLGLVLGLLFIHEHNAEEKKQKQFLDDLSKEQEKKDIRDSPTTNYSKEASKKKVRKVICTLRFWKLVLISFFINFAVYFITNTSRTFGALIGINGTALQFTTMFQLGAMIIVIPVLGILIDKKGPLLILRIIAINCIIPALLLTFFMQNSFVFILSYVLSVVNLAGSMIGFAPFIMEVYGIQESVILGGYLSGVSKFGDALSSILAFLVSFPSEEEKNNPELKTINLMKKYRSTYICTIIGSVISVILLFLEKPEKFKYESSPKEITISDDNMQMNLLPRDSITSVTGEESSKEEVTSNEEEKPKEEEKSREEETTQDEEITKEV